MKYLVLTMVAIDNGTQAPHGIFKIARETPDIDIDRPLMELAKEMEGFGRDLSDQICIGLVQRRDEIPLQDTDQNTAMQSLYELYQKLKDGKICLTGMTRVNGIGDRPASERIIIEYQIPVS